MYPLPIAATYLTPHLLPRWKPALSAAGLDIFRNMEEALRNIADNTRCGDNLFQGLHGYQTTGLQGGSGTT